jgi:hypothetical protein
LETGRRLIEIRDRFKGEPGKWSRLIGANDHHGNGLLPFSARHAFRLIAIAEDPRLVTHVSLMPSDTYTLYQLTRLSAPVFDDKLAEGAISPELQRADVQLWLNRINRADRFKALAAPALPDDPVSVLLADPPWQFKVWRNPAPTVRLLNITQPRRSTISARCRSGIARPRRDPVCVDDRTDAP